MNERCPTCNQIVRDPTARVMAWMIHRLVTRPGTRRGELTVACSSRDRATLREVISRAVQAGFVVDDGKSGLRIA